MCPLNVCVVFTESLATLWRTGKVLWVVMGTISACVLRGADHHITELSQFLGVLTKLWVWLEQDDR